MRARARLQLAVRRLQLAKRIENLKAQEGDDPDQDMPQDAHAAADQAFSDPNKPPLQQGRLSRALKADIFRAVVIAKTKEMKAQQEAEANEKRASISKPPPGANSDRRGASGGSVGSSRP